MEEYNELEQYQEISKVSMLAAAASVESGEREAPKQYVEAPFLHHTENETVSLNSGSLQLQVTDLAFPGKNGFDLVISRTYDSSAANVEDFNLYYDQVKKHKPFYNYIYEYNKGYDDRPAKQLLRVYAYYASSSDLTRRIKNTFGVSGKKIWNKDESGYRYYYYSENGQSNIFLSTALRSNDHYIKTYGLGYGWRFNFPSIEYVIEQDGKPRHATLLHLEDGRTLRIENPTTSPYFKNYALKDVQIQRSGDAFIVSYKDGKKAYFDTDNRLSHMQDRFGNQIAFAYDNGTGRLNRITDTFGRVLLLEMGSDTKLRIKREDTGEIECQYELTDGALTTFRDKIGRMTRYAYDRQIGRAQICHNYSNDEPVNITFVNLKEVSYPTGARSVYTYEATEWAFPEPAGGSRISYVVSSRKDIIGYGETEQTLNEESYTYHTAKDYANSSTEGFGEDIGSENYINHYINEATVLSYKSSPSGAFEVKTVDTFDKDGLRTATKVYHVVSGVEKMASSQTFTYTNKLPKRIVGTVYNYSGQSMTKTTEYTYSSNNRGDIIKQIVTYSSDPSCNQEVNYVYDANYSIPIETRTRKNDGTEIVVRSTLRAEADNKPKVAEQVCTYEKTSAGEALKERTILTYDEAYRLTAQRRYYGDDLETAESCVTDEFGYADNAFTTEPTTHMIINVKDANGNLITPMDASDADGTIKQTAAFDWYGRQTSATDGNGHTSTVEYDGIGRKVKETNPDGTYRTTSYDDANNRIITADEAGNRTQLQYTPLGRIERESLLDGEMKIPVASFTYDHLERLTEQAAFDGSGMIKNHTVQTFDLYDNVVSKITMDNAGTDLYQETYEYEPVVESRYSRMTKTVAGDNAAPSIVTQETKDQLGRVSQERMKDSEDFTITYTYDRLGNKLTQVDPKGNVTRWDYDHAGRVTKETNAAGKSFLSTYDALGRKVSATDPKGNVTQSHYDAAGRLIRQEAPFEGEAQAVSRCFYDMAGNVLKQEVLCSAPGGPEVWKKTEYRYDNRDRVTDTILFEADGSENRTRYEYDAVGNKVAVYTSMLGDSLDGAAKTTCEYNRFGKVVKMVDPRSNALSADDPLYLAETSVYDAVGRLVSKTDRNKNTTVYVYDALDRVLSETVEVNGVVENNTHSYTKTDQKLSETNSTLAVTYRYDARGRLVEQTESDGVVKSYAYDAAGNRIGFILTRGGTAEMSLSYAYDSLNQLTEVKKDETVIARYTYDDNGNCTSLEYPDSGLMTTHTFNAANLITALVNKRGDTTVSSFSCAYYLDGNQRSKIEADGRVTDYVYDSMGRLIQESEAEGNTISYAYDRFSNRSSMTVTGGETYTTTYSYHPNNWLLTEEKRGKDTVETYRYRYDGNGNQVYREWSKTGPDDGTPPRVGYVPNGFRRELATLEIRGYNGFNQMVSLYADGERTAYTYRPDGLRYGKTYGSGADATGVTHLWDGQNIVAEIGATGNVVARYLRGANLIAREQDGALQYYLHNAHGDVVQRTDALGNLLKNYRYDAFGNEKDPEPLDVNPFRYGGEYFDRETGDYYLRARSYDPRTGRFTAEDPARSEANWYPYCGNNPLTFFDPSGLLLARRDKVKTPSSTSKFNPDPGIEVFTSAQYEDPAKAFQNHVDKNAVWIDEREDEIIIYARAHVVGDPEQDAAWNEEYRRHALEGIVDAWGGGQYNGKPVNILIADVKNPEALEKDQNYFTIELHGPSATEASRTPFTDDPNILWDKAHLGTMILYNSNPALEKNRKYTVDDFRWTAGHEFGHILGIDDNYYRELIKGTNRYRFIGWGPTLSIMNNQFVAQHAKAVDYAKMLQAHKSDQWQKWSEVEP